MLFALQAVTEERSASQVDEYLTWSRQTGSTLKCLTSILTVNRHKNTRMHTFAVTRPDANTPSTQLQSLSCFSSDVNTSVPTCTHMRSKWTHTHIEPSIKVETSTSRNQDRAKQNINQTLPWQHDMFVNMRKMLTCAKGAAGVHCVSHSDYRANLNGKKIREFSGIHTVIT